MRRSKVAMLSVVSWVREGREETGAEAVTCRLLVMVEWLSATVAGRANEAALWACLSGELGPAWPASVLAPRLAGELEREEAMRNRLSGSRLTVKIDSSGQS